MGDIDIDRILYDAEQGWRLSDDAMAALVAEVRALRAKVERVEAAAARMEDRDPHAMIPRRSAARLIRDALEVRS